MKSKPLMLLLVAAGCGLVAMVGVQQMLSGGKPAALKVQIAVARMEIGQGIKLDNLNVVMKEWPQEHIPEGAITSEDQFAERALKHHIGPGQPILIQELGEKGIYGLDIKIPAGMRAIGIAVTATMTNSGLLKPGNFVDVNAAVEITLGRAADRQTEVKPVLQCIQVFAIDHQVVGAEESKDPKAKDSKVVSFLVYPNQARLLYLAEKRSNGSLQFALRSSSDKAIVNASDLDDESMAQLTNSLFGRKEEPERKEPAVRDVAVVEREPVPEAVKPRNAFQNYIAPETASAFATVGDQAVRRTWKIEIYQGEQREVQELDWPDDVPEAPKKHGGVE